MGADQNFDWQSAAASALEWWHDVGVETLVDESPRDWMAAPVAMAAAPGRRNVPVAVTAIAPTPVALPETLPAFVAWRTGPEAPEAAWSGPPIAATGDPASDVMILLDVPDREDMSSGTLLTGAAGRLFDRMLAAVGRTRESVYLAAVCTARPVAGRNMPEVEARLGDIARHHVALIAPKRLLVLGNAPSRALTGADVALARGSLHAINLDAGKVRVTTVVVASFHPRFLLERPSAKAEAWKDLQMLMAGLDQ